jgi:hypothetical protein
LVITYSWEELLDIRAAVTHQNYQHYDQEYNFPGAIELIPEADPKHRRRRKGTRGSLLVQLRRHAHHPRLPSILLANVQSFDNKVDALRARISFQRDIGACNILRFVENWLSQDTLSKSVN